MGWIQNTNEFVEYQIPISLEEKYILRSYFQLVIAIKQLSVSAGGVGTLRVAKQQWDISHQLETVSQQERRVHYSLHKVLF
jgi:hypothetical protein